MVANDLFGKPDGPCQHANLRFVPTPENIHHGKEVCAKCGRFIRWMPKPANQERDLRNQRWLEELAAKPLTEWERGFVLSLTKQGCGFTPKQQPILDRLALTYGCK